MNYKLMELLHFPEYYRLFALMGIKPLSEPKINEFSKRIWLQATTVCDKDLKDNTLKCINSDLKVFQKEL